MNMENLNMTPSEKLTMLLDGETAGIDSSEVFYELSNNPELQQEFLDTLKLRQMMSEIPEAPPERLKRGIMAGIGLGGSGLWYYLQNSGIIAATAAFVSSKVGTALIAGMLGVVATFLVMDNSEDNSAQLNNSNNVSNLETISQTPIIMEVPLVSSISQESTTQSSSLNNVRNSASNSLNVIAAVDKETNASKGIILINDSSPTTSSYGDENAIFSSKEDLVYNENLISTNSNQLRSGFIVNPSNRMSQQNDNERLMLFSLQAKGISNNSFTKADMSTTEAPAINDIGIALMYTVTDDFSLGLEFGQEFFVQKVNADGISNEESLNENQLTFWGGLKASYTFNEAQIINNLRPTTALLIGGTSRGWVTKASAGLTYDISNKLSVYGGPEWTTGVYKFDSNILSTHKWGFYYGMALKF